jgi:hypothetical protein
MLNVSECPKTVIGESHSKSDTSGFLEIHVCTNPRTIAACLNHNMQGSVL